MWKKLLVLVLILGLVFTMTACAEKSEIQDEDEAAQALEDVTDDLEEISDALEEIDTDLG